MPTATLTSSLTLPFTAAQLVARLRSQEGVTEDPPGSNRTPYGAHAGINGKPWCAALPCWAWDTLAGSDRFWRTWWHRLGTDLAFWTPALAAAGRRAGLAVPIAAARAGDLVFYDWPDGVDRVQHIETAVGPWAGGRLPVIGGNTSPDDRGSQSSGGGVFLRHRTSSGMVAVIRPPFRAVAVTAPKPSAAGTNMTSRLTRLLREGSRGDDVRAVQTRLHVAVDGIYGPATRAAVLAFQRRAFRAKSAHDGVVGPDTARALGFSWGAPAPARKPVTTLRRTLHQGDRGEDVRRVQARLHVTVDGIYGPRTRAAVLAFQRRYFTAASQHDGVVGPNTARALGFGWAA